MPAKVSRDLEKLKTAFPFEAGPYGAVIENGRRMGAVSHFEENGEPAVTLKKLGVIEWLATAGGVAFGSLTVKYTRVPR